MAKQKEWFDFRIFQVHSGLPGSESYVRRKYGDLKNSRVPWTHFLKTRSIRETVESNLKEDLPDVKVTEITRSLPLRSIMDDATVAWLKQPIVFR